MSKIKSGAAIAAGPVIACCVTFTPIWEGMDKVAKRDMIGTGHPITYCNGLTSADGAVKVGQRFTKEECDKALAAALPKYWAKIEPCIEVPLPTKTAGSLLDAAWNAGPGAVCRSPMLAHMNAGDLRAGCNAFSGWYVRSDGKFRAGLDDRRSGNDHGDPRKSEKKLCLEGVAEGQQKFGNEHFDIAAKIINARLPESAPAAEVTPKAPVAVSAPRPLPKPKHIAKPAVPKAESMCWLWRCT